MLTEILCGDNLPILQKMPDNSVDAIVTDPPYGLSFMGKRWDYDVPSVELWAECLRVLKPGGHLLAFAGTRTQHRMAVRIEDAGFEIRDMIAWVYGSGFPKSLDVSKAIDKNNGEVGRLLRFTEWMRTTGLTSKQIDEATGTNMGGHYLTAKSQPAIPTRRLWAKLRPLCGYVPEWVDELVERIEAEREVVGKAKWKTLNEAPMPGADCSAENRSHKNITAPATDAAKQWQGWGTALKPALEPITVARKPLVGTVAENVLTHGTGALNIDGCRVGTDIRLNQSSGIPGAGRMRACNQVDRGDGKTPDGRNLANLVAYAERSKDRAPQQVSGRWPANLIHDGSDEVVRLFPQSTSGANPTRRGGMGYHGAEGQESCDAPRGADTGSAARFFYCAKASRSEREAGLEGIEPRLAGCMNMRNDNHAQQNGLTFAPKSNHHPTVKPIALMRYLCRLVTPPGGIVLDPFTGSGTTGCAATLEGFGFIGIEREAEYAEIARRRIEHWRDVASQDETIIEDVQEKLFAEMI